MYIKISRPEYGKTSYISPLEDLKNFLDSEFDGASVGDKIVLEVVEMSDDEFEKLDEFCGW